MTNVVYFSGVHGSGKTSIRNAVTQRLQKAGMSVYAFPEFSYIPDIPIGTPEFQLWYRTQLRIRQELIQYLVNTKYFDIILVDRHPIDERIYAKRLGGNDDLEYELQDHEIQIFIHRPIHSIVASLASRMKEEGQEHRQEWDEDNKEYLEYINEEFHKLYRDQKVPNEKAHYPNLEKVNLLSNKDHMFKLTVSGALEIILRSVK